jgi:hypothetical protein
MTPIPPLCSAVAVQLHCPAVVVHVAIHPMAEKILAILSHVTGTDETVRHAAANGNVMLPLVIVPSV